MNKFKLCTQMLNVNIYPVKYTIRVKIRWMGVKIKVRAKNTMENHGTNSLCKGAIVFRI